MPIAFTAAMDQQPQPEQPAAQDPPMLAPPSDPNAPLYYMTPSPPKGPFHGTSDYISTHGLIPYYTHYSPYVPPPPPTTQTNAVAVPAAPPAPLDLNIEPLLLEANILFRPSSAMLAAAPPSEHLMQLLRVDLANARPDGVHRDDGGLGAPKLAMGAAHLNVIKDQLYSELPTLERVDKDKFVRAFRNVRPGELFGMSPAEVGITTKDPLPVPEKAWADPIPKRAPPPLLPLPTPVPTAAAPAQGGQTAASLLGYVRKPEAAAAAQQQQVRKRSPPPTDNGVAAAGGPGFPQSKRPRMQ